MYRLLIKPYADRVFTKLAKKNPNHAYKFLRNPLQNFNRVHIDGHFVLVFRVIHPEETVEIWYYDHHDEICKGKFLPQE